MRNLPIQLGTSSNTQFTVYRRQIGLAFGLSLFFTLIVGLPLAVIFDNGWWLTWSGFAGLFFYGIVMVAQVGTGRLFSGTMIALSYSSPVVIVYLAGQLLDTRRAPPMYVSTFLFFWPLAQIFAGVLRLFAGGLSQRCAGNGKLILLRLSPIITALGVIILGTFRPLPPLIRQTEWQQPPPAVGGVRLNEFMVTPLSLDEEGELWFGYKRLLGVGGVGHFVPTVIGRERWQLHPARTSSDELAFGFVLALLPDDQGGIWVSNLKGRLSRYDRQTATWQKIAAFQGDILAMLVDGGRLWVATFGQGVACYDPQSEQWTTYTKTSTGGGLQDDEVVALIADGSGGLWAGTYGGGVSHYDPNRDAWQAFTVASTGGKLRSNDVRALTINEAGALWVGTFGGGISRYQPRLDRWELYTAETTGGGLALDYVLTLLPGENGSLWAGLSNLRNQGGLGYFDGRRWRSYTVVSTGDGLLSNDVRALAPDGVGGVWVGTRNGGLSHLASDHQTWTTFTVESTRSGLAGNTVLALLPDGVGSLWVGTGSGLSHLRWTAP